MFSCKILRKNVLIFMLFYSLLIYKFTNCVSCPYIVSDPVVGQKIYKADCSDKCCDISRPTSISEACCSSQDTSKTVSIILGYSIPMLILFIGLVSCCCYCYCALHKHSTECQNNGTTTQPNSRISRIRAFFYQRTRQVEPEIDIKDNPPSYDELNITVQNTSNTGAIETQNDIERTYSPPPPYHTTRQAW